VAGNWAQTLATEARDAASDADRLTCALLLLAGKVDAAAAALTRAAPLGWSQPAHPGPVVPPCPLAAATARPPAEQTHLGQAFAAIDIDLRQPSYRAFDFGQHAAELAPPRRVPLRTGHAAGIRCGDGGGDGEREALKRGERQIRAVRRFDGGAGWWA
jgi:hypothetical protein